MSSSQPLVSVIMPAYNAESYIEESILSLIHQTYQNWELIIVNDGSTDQTVEIARSFLKKDNRLRLINNETNEGLIVTRNKGLESAKGKYIANLDSDDIALPNRLKKQVAFLEKHQEYVLLGAGCIHIDKEGKKLAEVERNIPNTHLKSLLLFSNYFINSTVMFRTEEVKKVTYQKGFAPAEDYELFSQIGKYGEIGNLPEPLVKYRIHDHNISSLKKEEQQKAISNIIKNQLQSLGIIPSDNELKLHVSLVDGFFEWSELPQVETWLSKLIERNTVVRKYPIDIFNYFCAFFYRRACEKSKLGLRAIKKFKSSPLSKYITRDFKGNSVFFVKSIFKLS